MSLKVIEDPDTEFAKAMEVNQMSEFGRNAIREVYKDKKTYIEWGSGGSTLWHIKELMESNYSTQLISIEHDLKWFANLSKVVKNKYSDITEQQFLFLHKPAMMYEVGGSALNVISTPFEENPAFLSNYVNPPEVNLSDADVFLVDGLARSTCLCVLANKAKVGSTVFLHDIDKREDWYKIGVDLITSRSEVSYVYHNLIRFDIVK